MVVVLLVNRGNREGLIGQLEVSTKNELLFEVITEN